MVFQSYALFPHLSVAENIVFGLKVRKVPPAERSARLAKTADILGLEKLLDRKPSQLSGGQQQRVALGRAIVAETPVCLMDEPLSNLDAQLRVEMRREIRSLQQRLGITMIYVTHDQLEAMTMADQVILMNAGRIEQQGPPADLYERPETIFTARFVGTPPMNVLTSSALPGLGEADLRRRAAGPPARGAGTGRARRGGTSRRCRGAGAGGGRRVSGGRYAGRYADRRRAVHRARAGPPVGRASASACRSRGSLLQRTGSMQHRAGVSARISSKQLRGGVAAICIGRM